MSRPIYRVVHLPTGEPADVRDFAAPTAADEWAAALGHDYTVIRIHRAPLWNRLARVSRQIIGGRPPR